jgi:hypothetical protein
MSSNNTTSHASIDGQTNDTNGKNAAAHSAAASKKKTPYERMLENYTEVMSRVGATGSDIMRGMDFGEPPVGDANTQEEEVSEAECMLLTQEQVDRFRVIMITEERNQAMMAMDKLVLGDQYGQKLLMFRMSFSYHVLDAFETFKRQYQRTKDPAKKLNLLLGFTNAIGSHDYWMHKHESEWEGGKMVDSLAGMWKKLLKLSPEQLGIDAEFTLPGLHSFLQQTKTLFESVDTEDPTMYFNYE